VTSEASQLDEALFQRKGQEKPRSFKRLLRLNQADSGQYNSATEFYAVHSRPHRMSSPQRSDLSGASLRNCRT